MRIIRKPELILAEILKEKYAKPCKKKPLSGSKTEWGES